MYHPRRVGPSGQRLGTAPAPRWVGEVDRPRDSWSVEGQSCRWAGLGDSDLAGGESSALRGAHTRAHALTLMGPLRPKPRKACFASVCSRRRQSILGRVEVPSRGSGGWKPTARVWGLWGTRFLVPGGRLLAVSSVGGGASELRGLCHEGADPATGPHPPSLCSSQRPPRHHHVGG